MRSISLDGVTLTQSTTPGPVLRLDARNVAISGCGVRINDTFRLGAVKLEWVVTVGGGYRVMPTMSSATWSSLVTEKQRSAHTPALDVLERAIADVKVTIKTTMVELGGKGPTKVVDRRRVARYTDDRVDFVGRGISDLVSQMSNLLSKPSASRSDGTVASVAKRYAELASEMKLLRAALTDAEGRFEIASTR